MELERPTKRTKLFPDDDNSSSHGGQSITINQAYAKRYEHNKQREERHRLEEAALDEETESSSDSEEEDEDGILASGDLDDNWHATLRAIKDKDPQIYDPNHKFYTEVEDALDVDSSHKKSPKPMHLRDYHRANLLNGDQVGTSQSQDRERPQTYEQEQKELRDAVIQEIHGGEDAHLKVIDGDTIDDESDEDFLVTKTLGAEYFEPTNAISTNLKHDDALDLDAEPDAFLEKYLSTQAWKLPKDSRLHPFESDDDEEEARAEAYEEAYNLRFEDPQRSNEKLLTHARDSAAKHSARKTGLSVRKRAREVEKSRKEAEKQKRATDKARLRQLRIHEMEKKLQKIKEAAGLREEALDEAQWSALLEGAWDNEDWEREMTRNFGEKYYAEQDLIATDVAPSGKKERVKKPKWKDDINIGDLVPEFLEQNALNASFVVSQDGVSEPHHGPLHDVVGESESPPPAKGFKGTDRRRPKTERDKQARRERRHIERVVEERLDDEEIMASAATKHQGTFRYRETSPVAYGMTPSDILLASDSQLNQFAGLKKLAAFRAPDLKSKDKRRLGKKARLREWRKEAFGNA